MSEIGHVIYLHDVEGGEERIRLLKRVVQELVACTAASGGACLSDSRHATGRPRYSAALFARASTHESTSSKTFWCSASLRISWRMWS